MLTTKVKYLCLFSGGVVTVRAGWADEQTDVLIYMWPSTSHFLPTKQLTADKRDEQTDSENYYLISDENNHTSEGGLIMHASFVFITYFEL